MATTTVETHEFRAETRQLLQLMIRSVYSHKDVFLRELVSNASDALDKLRIARLVDKDLQAEASDPHILIEVDRDASTLTVRDNGIGMSRDEVVELIGTIAKSGTDELLQQLRDSDEVGAKDLIGQFGIGLYSTFMVADRVTVLSRRAGEENGTRWESTGDGTYTLESVEQAPQGTAVIVHLKPTNQDDQLFDYADEWTIRDIVKRHSDFIAWPIRMEVEKVGAGDDATEEAEEGAAEGTAREVVTLNSMKALWARPRSEVEDHELCEFYRHLSRDWNDPLEIVQMKAEGTFEYEALLFLPSQAPYDLYMRGSRRGIQLYVKRVFVMDDCWELLPDYLRFVTGVVDARDLSLNVSREILQQDRQIYLMRRRLVKKVLAAVKDLMTRDPDRYETFWREFGRAVKEGLVQDPENQGAILDIASFASTHDPVRPTTLQQYVERMKDGQEEIYFTTGESRSVIEHSPHMEAFHAKGYEVLLLTDPIDVMWVETVREFDGKRLRSVTNGPVDLASESTEQEADEPERDEQREAFTPLLSWLSETLREQVTPEGAGLVKSSDLGTL